MPLFRLAALFLAAAFVALMLAPVLPVAPGANIVAASALEVAAR
jgi:hypothetical protein